MFGKKRLDEIRVRGIDRFRARKLQTHSGKTVNNILTVLWHSLEVAARWEWIEPVPSVSWAKAKKPEFRFLDFEEADRLVEAAEVEELAHGMIVWPTRRSSRGGAGRDRYTQVRSESGGRAQ